MMVECAALLLPPFLPALPDLPLLVAPALDLVLAFEANLPLLVLLGFFLPRFETPLLFLATLLFLAALLAVVFFLLAMVKAAPNRQVLLFLVSSGH